MWQDFKIGVFYVQNRQEIQSFLWAREIFIGVNLFWMKSWNPLVKVIDEILELDQSR